MDSAVQGSGSAGFSTNHTGLVPTGAQKRHGYGLIAGRRTELTPESATLLAITSP